MKTSKWLCVLVLFVLLSVKVQGADLHDEMVDLLEIEEYVEWVQDSASAVGSLTWTGQSLDKIDYTFQKEMDLTGTAEPGTHIYYGIVLLERGGLNLWEKHVVEVGPAGLVQEKMSLPLIGQHYVIVVVEEKGQFLGSIYTIHRRSESLEEELQDFRLNLYVVCSP